MEPGLIWTEGATTVWQFHLEVSQMVLGELTSTLNYFEKAHAESFSNPEFRSRFVIRRGMLRRLLGQQISCDPAKIEFRPSVNGKPTVIGHQIHFSASSSSDYGLLACSPDHQIGVDIEKHNEVLASPSFEFLTDSESRTVKDATESPEPFFRIWARKEACIKATGQGLRYDLRTLDVLADFVEMPEPVQIWDLPVPEGYSAALAMVLT